jgi:diadenosine tetraphosphate (Ap4A) HIT family hydrolase
MSRWRDPEAWAQLLRPEDCPICQAGAPRDLLAELEVSRVTMGEEGPLPGYCCLVLRRHAVELHELSAEEAAALMRDLQRLTRAVQAVTGAVKLNLEVHGNTLPHLHVHVFPRYVGDAFEGRPIDPRLARGSAYAPGELARLRERLLVALSEG